jgi:hypothetical protein
MCFPASATLDVTLLREGWTDMAGNFLRESVRRTFTVSDRIEQGERPMVVRTEPQDQAQGVALEAPLEVWFDRPMAKSSIQPRTVLVGGTDSNWWLRAFDTADVAQNTATTRTMPFRATNVLIFHDPLKSHTLYHPVATSEVEDLLQQCLQG